MFHSPKLEVLTDCRLPNSVLEESGAMMFVSRPDAVGPVGSYCDNANMRERYARYVGLNQNIRGDLLCLLSGSIVDGRN